MQPIHLLNMAPSNSIVADNIVTIIFLFYKEGIQLTIISQLTTQQIQPCKSFLLEFKSSHFLLIFLGNLAQSTKRNFFHLVEKQRFKGLRGPIEWNACTILSPLNKFIQKDFLFLDPCVESQVARFNGNISLRFSDQPLLQSTVG